MVKYNIGGRSKGSLTSAEMLSKVKSPFTTHGGGDFPEGILAPKIDHDLSR